MGGKHTRKLLDVRPWQSAKMDCREGRVAVLGNTLLLSEPLKNLSGNAFKLYSCMICESGGSKDFEFSRATGIKYGISYSTLTRAIKELVEVGMLKIALSGKSTRTKNLYSFAWDWKSECDTS